MEGSTNTRDGSIGQAPSRKLALDAIVLVGVTGIMPIVAMINMPMVETF